MRAIDIGIVGFGKIAHDQHVPALAVNADFSLIAVTAGTQPQPARVAVFATGAEMVEAAPTLQAVAICTPPQARHEIARYAIEHGLHVLLEKPPGTTLGEIEDLSAAARRQGVALFGSWHSREAPAVAVARSWLDGAQIQDIAVNWREDVRRWHPGQAWIWQPGGFGVFDPGINALSILTALMPRPLMVRTARLYYPDNRATPIAAQLELTDAERTPIHADFDWRQSGRQIWEIAIRTDRGTLRLADGGAELQLDGQPLALPPCAEYAALYRRFADLIRRRELDLDASPLRLVADAFTIGRREAVDAFRD